MGTIAGDIAKVVAGLEEQGCTVRKARQGYRVKFPNGESVTISASSEWRAQRNQRAVVRKNGLVWPLDPVEKTPKLPSTKTTTPTSTEAPRPSTPKAQTPVTDPFAVPSEPSSQVMTVTPNMATAWLERNTSNRKLTTYTVERYAEFMRNGGWHFDASPIRFAKNGRLLDGQHRLWAIIESETTQQFLVVTGLEERSFVTMDTGKKRGFSDVLSIEFPDAKDHTLLASVTVLIHRWDSGYRGKLIRPGGNGVRSTETPMETYLAFFADNTEAIEDVSRRGREIARRLPGYTSSMVALLLWIFEDIDEEDAEAFFTHLSKGTGLEEGHPILALRNFLYRWSSARDRRSALPTEVGVAVGIKAWNAYRAGRDIRVLNYRAGGANPEAFPIPE